MSLCFLLGNNGYFNYNERTIAPSGMAFSNTANTSSINVGQGYYGSGCALINNVIMSLDYYSTNSALSFITGVTGILINSGVLRIIMHK